MQVTPVITSYNALELTKRAVVNVLNQAGPEVQQIIVVDDGSQPRLPNFDDRRVKIIRNAQAKGYAAAVNQGIRAACGEVVLLLDCDAYLTSAATRELCQLFDGNMSLGVAGFVLTDESGEFTGSCEAEPTVWSLILGQSMYSVLQKLWPRGGPRVVYSCAIAIRKSCFNALGGFDEGFDFLDADVDFSMRVNRSNWGVLVTAPGLVAIHEGGGTAQSKAKRVVRFHRSRYRLLSKHDLISFPSLVRAAVALRAAVEYLIAFVLRFCTRHDKYLGIMESRAIIMSEFGRLKLRVSGLE